MTKTFTNIELDYNDKDYDSKKGKRFQIMELVGVVLAVTVGIIAMVLCFRLGMIYGYLGIWSVVGTVLLMITMISILGAFERFTYGKEVNGFRLIDWFQSIKDAKAYFDNGELSIEYKRKKAYNNITVNRLLVMTSCDYDVLRKTMNEDNFKLIIDAANKEEITVE